MFALTASNASAAERPATFGPAGADLRGGSRFLASQDYAPSRSASAASRQKTDIAGPFEEALSLQRCCALTVVYVEADFGHMRQNCWVFRQISIDFHQHGFKRWMVQRARHSGDNGMLQAVHINLDMCGWWRDA